MESIQDRLNKELGMGKSIANWVIGYYRTAGNQFSPSLNVPIFDYIDQSRNNTMVLIDYLGSMMWINVRPESVFYDNGGEKGKLLRFKLEVLMCNN